MRAFPREVNPWSVRCGRRNLNFKFRLHTALDEAINLGDGEEKFIVNAKIGLSLRLKASFFRQTGGWRKKVGEAACLLDTNNDYRKNGWTWTYSVSYMLIIAFWSPSGCFNLKGWLCLSFLGWPVYVWKYDNDGKTRRYSLRVYWLNVSPSWERNHSICAFFLTLNVPLCSWKYHIMFTSNYDLYIVTCFHEAKVTSMENIVFKTANRVNKSIFFGDEMFAWTWHYGACLGVARTRVIASWLRRGEPGGSRS